MKIFSKILFLFCTLFFSCFTSQADIDPDPNPGYHPEIIPPAPTVASLGKYGDVPVNMATGAITLGVPLFDVKVRAGTLPISLSYSSNGVRVDAIASWVGMDWSLNAGGVICRTIKGGPDETTREPIPYDLDSYSPGTVDFLINHWNRSTDTEPDLFNYNFNGYSGKFIIGENGYVYCIPYNNLKIEFASDMVTYRGIKSFTITTPDGVKYLFGEEYTDSTDRTRECNFRSYAKGMRTAWHLKNINYPDGEYFNFFYNQKYLAYYSGISQTYSAQGVSNECEECPDGNNYACAQYLITHTQHLTRIVSSNHDSICFFSSSRIDAQEKKLDSILVFASKFNGTGNSSFKKIKRILFNYETVEGHGFSYNRLNLYTNNPELKYRMFLNGVKIFGSLLEEPSVYEFSYYDPSALPKRLSFAQDHWGYYNAESNYDFVVPPDYLADIAEFKNIRCNREPKENEAKFGMLKSVKYPTKGFSEFNYEQNTYTKGELVSPPLNYVYLDVEGACNSIISDTITFTVPVTQVQILNATCVYDSNSCPKGFSEYSLKDLTNNTYLIQNARIYPGHSNNHEINYTQNHQYLIKIRTRGSGTTTTVTAKYYLIQPYFVKVQKSAGGMRIKQIINKNNYSDPDTISYFYGNLANITESSGVPGLTPTYIDHSTIKKMCDGFEGAPVLGSCNIINLFSNSLNNLFNVGGYNIMYQSVIKANGSSIKNGGEIDYFEINIDEPGEIVEYCTDPLIGATLNNSSWNNGQLMEKMEFKSKGMNIIPVKKSSYIYSTDTRKDTTFFGFVFRKNYDLIYNSNYTYYCTAKDLEPTFTCVTNHQHNWFMTGFTNPPSLICIAPFARMEIRYQNGCTFEGEEKTITTALDNFSGIRYDIYLKWNHLDSLIAKTFSSSGTDSVTEITYYRYDNPEHALPTLTRITDSKNATIENQCYYPQDYNNSFNELVDKHIIGVPVDQRKIMDGILTSGTLFHYDSFGNITGIDKAENELGTSVGFSNGNPFSYGTRKTNLSYDQDGCLNAVKNLDDIEINYLWGYRSQYPIAEISGSAIAEINNILIQGGFSVSILKHSLDDSYINSATIYLRNNLPNALVVSYTYDPQIGITSKTEANGMKSYFVYNSNGKLSEIKDSNGKIIRKFNYHYASD